MSATAQPPGERWRDGKNTQIPVGAVVKQTGVDLQLVIRFEGETALTRLQPALLRVAGPR